MDERRLEARLEALERAVTEGDSLPELAEAAAAATDAADREARLDDLTERVAELEAATRALRGYVGNVRSVNEAVEERADAAVARVEEVERRLAALESGADSGTDPTERAATEGDAPAASATPSEEAVSVGAEDPDWLAAADDRLPDDTRPDDRDDQRTGEATADGGLAARLGDLL